VQRAERLAQLLGRLGVLLTTAGRPEHRDRSALGAADGGPRTRRCVLWMRMGHLQRAGDGGEQAGVDVVDAVGAAGARLGFGRIAASDIEAPNMLAILV
jgi:hypothetical protein